MTDEVRRRLRQSLRSIVSVEDEWRHAIELTRNAKWRDPGELAYLLRDPEMELPMASREAMAELLVTLVKRRPGRPKKDERDYFQEERILDRYTLMYEAYKMKELADKPGFEELKQMFKDYERVHQKVPNKTQIIGDLANEFGLSEDSIKRIIRSRREGDPPSLWYELEPE